MRAVIVPARAGVFSAVGMLARRRHKKSCVRSRVATGGALAAVAAEAQARVGAGAVVETAVDCRYVGQSHELTVADVAAFPAEHERRNGHERPGAPVEVVAVRARAISDAPLQIRDFRR